MESLTILWLYNCNLSGSIPKSIVNLTELTNLDLSGNRLNGTLPPWLFTIPSLYSIDMSYNQLTGPIPGTLGVRIFDLSDNEFTGLLPSIYFQNFTAMKNSKETEGGAKYMESGDSYYQDSIAVVWNGVEVEFEHILTTLATIDLSANNFVGHIPEALQEVNSLRMLNLSHNSLTGSIPPSLGNLSNLQILDLSSNILTGTIPIQLARITTLARFNVSYNHLVGRIPSEKQFNTFQNNSYIENSRLCGLPLSDLCGDYKKPQSPFQKISSGFTWKIVLFGYGCEVPFGLILDFLMFFIGWPRWFLGIAGPQNGRPRRRRNHT